MSEQAYIANVLYLTKTGDQRDITVIVVASNQAEAIDMAVSAVRENVPDCQRVLGGLLELPSDNDPNARAVPAGVTVH